MAITIIGPTYIDFSIRVKTLPLHYSLGLPDTSIAADDLEWLPGGTGFSYAIALRHLLKEQIRLFTCIGTGYFSDYLRNFAKKHEVKVISQSFDDDADIAVVLITEDGGKLAISHRKITSHFQVQPNILETLKQKDVVIITSIPASSIVDILKNIPEGVTVMLAPNMRLCKEATIYAKFLPKVSIVSASEKEIIALKERAKEELKAVDTVIETRGIDGARIFRRDEEVKTYHPYRRIERPVSTSGAGEAFGAAFLVARLNGLDDDIASNMAAFYASEHIMKKDRQDHLFPQYSWKELLDRIQS